MGLDNPLHIIFILVVLLLVFGAKRIPEIARGLGTGINEFKDAVSGGSKSTITPAAEQPVATPPAPPVQATAAPAQAAVPEFDGPQPEPQHQA
jgi:sec-independent protein translocase protein TatA